jgi:hypothetical protein
MRRDFEKRGGVYRFKELKDNPHLLERFLDSQVGRPWDKIYSEIRSNPDSRRSIGLSILERIKRLVATDCFIENRRVLRPGHLCPHPPDGLYVHPKTGRLARAAPRRYERRRPEATRVMIDDLHWYECIDGIWYRLDHKIHRNACLDGNREFRVQTGKKQCSKKELKWISECIQTGRGAFYLEKSWGKERWISACPSEAGGKPR